MIPESWLEELKRRVDLVRLGETHGVRWQSRGGHAFACCPFHEERTPSFHALEKPHRGVPRFVCYGACDRSWSAVSFLVDGHGFSFLDAVTELAKLAGMAVPRENETAQARAAREAAQAWRKQIYQAIQYAQVYFAAALQADRPEAATAREYVRARGLWDAVEAWGIGFAPGGNGLERWLGQNGISREIGLAACLLGEKDGRIYPFFWDGRITFPWRDRRGRVVAHVGRTLEAGREPKYLNPREIDGIFHKGELVFGLDRTAADISRAGEAIVVEGQISAMIPWLHGIRNVVACGGKAFSTAHARLLMGSGAQRVVFVMDGDAAGRVGAESAIVAATEEGLSAAVVDLPDEMDPDDALRALSPYARCTRKPEYTPARPFRDYLTQQRRDGVLWLAERIAADCRGPLEVERALRERILPILSILGPIAADSYCKDLAQVFGVSVRALRALLAGASLVEAKSIKGDSGKQPQQNGGEDTDDEVAAALEEFNKRHFVVAFGGVTYVGRWAIDPASGREDLTFSTFGDFTRYYSNIEVWVPSLRRSGGMRREEVSKLWLKSDRPTYEGVVFDPADQAPKGFLNLWRGFGVDAHEGDCSLYWNHVRKVICLDNPELYHYVRCWMAHAVQRPAELPEVAIVIRGLQGVGKGAWARYFGQIFGQHYLPVSNMEHVSGRFNGHLKDVLLLFADEALWGGKRETEGNLKALITEPWVSIESKGKDLVRVRNYKRVAIASNRDWPIARDRDDRRTVVIDVSDAHKEDRAYFRDLHQQMMTRGGLEALLWDLQHEDLNGFDPRERPGVDAGFDIKLRTASNVHQWWHELLSRRANSYLEADPEDAANPGPLWKTQLLIHDLHKDYLRWADRLGRRFLETREHWARDLREVAPHIEVYRPRVKAGLPRRRYYELDDVDICRRAFEKAFQVGPEIWRDGDDEMGPGVPL